MSESPTALVFFYRSSKILGQMFWKLRLKATMPVSLHMDRRVQGKHTPWWEVLEMRGWSLGSAGGCSPEWEVTLKRDCHTGQKLAFLRFTRSMLETYSAPQLKGDPHIPWGYGNTLKMGLMFKVSWQIAAWFLLEPQFQVKVNHWMSMNILVISDYCIIFNQDCNIETKVLSIGNIYIFYLESKCGPRNWIMESALDFGFLLQQLIAPT